MALTATFLVLLASTAARASPSSSQGHACELQYDTASLLIAIEIERSGDRKALQTTLDDAWQAIWKEGDGLAATRGLDALVQLLDRQQTRAVTSHSKTLLTEAIAGLRECAKPETPLRVSTLDVSLFYLDETGSRGAPVGAGIYLYVDGTPVAKTDASGRATVTVPAGTVAVQAIEPSSAVAEATIEAPADAVVPVQMLMDDSKEVTSPVQLVISSLHENVLPSGFDNFTIALKDGRKPRVATSFSEVVIEDDIGNTLETLTDMFHLDTQGSLQPDDLPSLVAKVMAYPGRSLMLRVTAEDALGFTLTGEQPFYLGEHTLNVRLVPPPSNPNLSVAGIQVTYQLMGTGLTLVRTSDATGTLSFGKVPLGNASLDSMTVQSGRYHYGQAIFFLPSSSLAVVTMAHTDDVFNGVPRFQLQSITNPDGSLPSGMDPFSDPRAVERRKRSRRSYSHPKSKTNAGSVANTINLRIGADQANQQVTGTRKLIVPQGTQRVVLRYLVSTQEYPEYVLEQSIYNDTWSLVVHGDSGQQLFVLGRNVNSQLSNPPSWLGDGSTGYIEQSFDVSARTELGSIELMLEANATNVSDSLLPTVVDADLSDDADRLIIEEVIPDELARTTGDHKSYSVPLQGENNRLSRWFTLKIDKPEGSQLTRVRAEVQNGNGTLPGGMVLEEGPGANVQIVDDSTLRVRVTFHDGATVDSAPPPAHAINYKFTVFAELQDGEEVSDEAISAIKRGLWRMPAEWRTPSHRYGFRDPGHDDWLSARTWDYIVQNAALLTRIDDISGEHGSNIGHETHDAGTDIDLYHVYRFPGAISGKDNYIQLRNTLVRVLSLPPEQTASDRSALTAWASQTRDRFAAILSTTDAEALYYSSGSRYAGSGIVLPEGWARTLLVQGVVTASGRQFDTQLGAWGFPQDRLRYNATHNSHFHIKRPRER